ncbi:MAG TPA: ABC-F family ATP-binding cassette domain-containing protein [Nocardioidaceae bacterium]|nr:ABC-F family ATP-binding cassette domain-containing protein [Nocardioidaceae bacterium]
MAAPTTLVGLESVTRSYGTRALLDRVSLGVAVGDRVGVVGRNGAGKSTLLHTLAGRQPPDGGRVVRRRNVGTGLLAQGDDLDPDATVRAAVLGGRRDHEWAADPTTREVVQTLLAGSGLDRSVGSLSGGERRRVALAALLLEDADLLLLDEPTNHLDVETVDWLARHLTRPAGATRALVVVTHDRWFLDAVSTTTWEVHDGTVDAYEGGYAAYVLARAERDRQTAAADTRRRNLVRKELAWLRRGPPARTSKPRFRIDAASALIADEPAPRDTLSLERFAARRLGRQVLELHDVDLVLGDRRLLDSVTWRLGPGDRIGLVGVNGAGKSSLLRLLAGQLEPTSGQVLRGRTVELALLSQEEIRLAPGARVLELVESVARVLRTADGELTATSLLERYGFTGDRLTARVSDLSGGERRRLQLLLELVGEPNVLLLDEPTNDLDIDTLTVLEDHLDSWPGTLVLVSHDRYVLERVCDVVYALDGRGGLRMLVRGVEEYLERRAAEQEAGAGGSVGFPDDTLRPAGGPGASGSGPAPAAGSAASREARKAVGRLDRQLARLASRAAALEARMAEPEVAGDHHRLAALATELREIHAERDRLEDEWLEAAERAGG